MSTPPDGILPGNDVHSVVVAVPLPAVLRAPSEVDPGIRQRGRGGERRDVETEPAVAGRRILYVGPAVTPPMHDRWLGQGDGEASAGGHRGDRRMRKPEGVFRCGAPALIALAYAARLIERMAEWARYQELDELGMRPGKRHCRARSLSGREATSRDRVRIPDLLGYHPAGARHRRHCFEIGQRIVAGAQLETPALPGQQRPSAADAGPVIRPAVLVLAISVVDIAVPDWAVWRLGPQQRVGQAQRALNQRIVGTAEAKPHELQKFGADLLVGAEPAAIVGAIADRHDEGAGAVVGDDARRRDPQVITG